MKRCYTAVAFVLAMILSAEVLGEVVKYEVTLDSNWTEDTHPIDYPTGGHYSTHIGATHDSDYTLWAPGEFSSPGIRTMAEMGLASPTDTEVAAAIDAGSAFQYINMAVVPVGVRGREFRVSDSHPLISMAGMLAPSPDWFIGFHDVNLQETGDWIDEISIEAWPYDAGTDNGETYRAANEVTEPFEPITPLVDGVMEGMPRFGVYTIKLVSQPGDLDESGTLDSNDIRALCNNLGNSDPRYEYDGDGEVTTRDLRNYVEARLGTRLGDANLDGSVKFDDFLSLSQNFGRDFRDWSRGDFNCDQTVNFDDFLLQSRNFGFTAEADGNQIDGNQINAVPEPEATTLIMMSLIALVLMCNGKSR